MRGEDKALLEDGGFSCGRTGDLRHHARRAQAKARARATEINPRLNRSSTSVQFSRSTACLGPSPPERPLGHRHWRGSHRDRRSLRLRILGEPPPLDRSGRRFRPRAHRGGRSRGRRRGLKCPHRQRDPGGPRKHWLLVSPVPGTTFQFNRGMYQLSAFDHLGSGSGAIALSAPVMLRQVRRRLSQRLLPIAIDIVLR